MTPNHRSQSLLTGLIQVFIIVFSCADGIWFIIRNLIKWIFVGIFSFDCWVFKFSSFVMIWVFVLI